MVQLAHQRQLLRHGGVTLAQRVVRRAVKNGVHLFVHTFHAGTDDGFHERVIHYTARGVQLHHTGECQPVRALVQAADAVGELARQHGNDAVRIIYRCAPRKRLGVQRAAGAHIMAHVRDVYAQPVSRIGLFQGNGVVDVFRLGGIYGEDRHAAVIPAARRLFFPHGRALVFFRFSLCLEREMAREPRAIQQCLCALLGLLGAAEAHGYARPVVLVGIAALQNLHRSLFTVARAAVGALFDIDGAVRTRVRHQRQPALNGLHRSGKAVVFLHHGQHLALGRALYARMLEQRHQQRVAGHGSHQVFARNEDILPVGLHRPREAKLARQLHQRTLHGVPCFRVRHGVHALAAHHLVPLHQLVHGAGHFFVVAQLRLQLFQAARLLLQLFQYFCFDSHNMLLTPHT